MKLNQAFALVIFLILLVRHVFFISLGFGNTITDLHGFRQTQTALTAYYLARDGFRLDYATPVLGYPWSIPFEFPSYQWAVAQVHNLGGLNLDMAGRLVSIACFYLSLLVMYHVLKSMAYTASERLIALSFPLLNPILLFWSRTFMIELAAVLFSMLFLFCLLKLLEDYKVRGTLKVVWLMAVVACGCLGAMTKVTTFAVYLICGLILFIRYAFSVLWEKRSRVVVKDSLITAFLCFALPVIAAFMWTSYSDEIKKSSYLGSTLVSSNLQGWNFGTLEQKFSYDIWHAIDDHSCHSILYAIVICIASVVLQLKHRWNILLFTFSGLCGPFLFTNLYAVHDYYSAANTLLLSVAIGFFTLSVWESRKRLFLFVPGFVLITVIAWNSVNLYFQRYYIPQINDHASMQIMGAEIRKYTTPEDVLMVTGTDWSSEVPYYSERKAVCVPYWIIPQIQADPQKFFARFESSGITTYAFFPNGGAVTPDGVETKIIKQYGLSETPIVIFSGHCLLFKKKETQN